MMIFQNIKFASVLTTLIFKKTFVIEQFGQYIEKIPLSVTNKLQTIYEVGSLDFGKYFAVLFTVSTHL